MLLCFLTREETASSSPASVRSRPRYKIGNKLSVISASILMLETLFEAYNQDIKYALRTEFRTNEESSYSSNGDRRSALSDTFLALDSTRWRLTWLYLSSIPTYIPAICSCSNASAMLCTSTFQLLESSASLKGVRLYAGKSAHSSQCFYVS
jgi:hypothetical protein